MPFTGDKRSRLCDHFRGWDQNDASRLYAHFAARIADAEQIIDLMADLPEQKQRPVTLFAAVHYLVLGGRSEALSRAFDAANQGTVVAEAWPAFREFCSNNAHELRTIMAERSIQTNEVNRCIALLPALSEVHRRTSRPLALVELGASAGLNLLFDLYHYEYKIGGEVGPPDAAVRLATKLIGPMPKLQNSPPPVAQRVGIDLRPIDVHDDDEVLWLRACLWPGDEARAHRLEAAVDLARRESPRVHQGDVVSTLPKVVEQIGDEAELCLFNSWMLGWMEEPDRNRLTDVIHEIGRDRSVWWISFEWPGKVPGVPDPDSEMVGKEGSVLALQHLYGDELDARVLAIMQHHGRWLNWLDRESAAQEF